MIKNKSDEERFKNALSHFLLEDPKYDEETSEELANDDKEQENPSLYRKS